MLAASGCWFSAPGAGLPHNREKTEDLVFFFGVLVNKELLTGTVMVNKESLMDTVLVNKELWTGTVSVNKELLTGTLPVNKKLLTGTCLSIRNY